MKRRIIALKFPGHCRACGVALAKGADAQWAGKGQIFCARECKDETGVGASDLTWKERYGQCEDAPCCGCCGSNAYGGYDDYSGGGSYEY